MRVLSIRVGCFFENIFNGNVVAVLADTNPALEVGDHGAGQAGRLLLLLGAEVNDDGAVQTPKLSVNLTDRLPIAARTPAKPLTTLLLCQLA